MKNNFYILVCFTAFIAISCVSSYKYRYETKNYNAVYKFTDKDIIIEDDFDYEIIDTLKDGSYYHKQYTKDSNLIAIYHNNLKPGIGCDLQNWYLNGKLRDSWYRNDKGEFQGIVKSFFENGNKRRLDYYNNGKLDSGTCWDINGNILKHFDYEREPGVNIQDISKNLIYPENLRRLNIEESIIARILIDSSGTPIRFSYDNNHSKEFIDEIARVIMLPGIFTPALRDNIPIMCWVSVPINFRLK
jgi:hypothetical protein